MIYRNTILIEVLSQGVKVEGDQILAYYSPAIGGDQSAIVLAEDSVIVDDASAARLLIMQGSSPSFFGLPEGEDA